ncbi:hypothetical protein GCM10023089_31960 [Quisquiliibacterium transsilvanicum]
MAGHHAASAAALLWAACSIAYAKRTRFLSGCGGGDVGAGRRLGVLTRPGMGARLELQDVRCWPSAVLMPGTAPAEMTLRLGRHRACGLGDRSKGAPILARPEDAS